MSKILISGRKKKIEELIFENPALDFLQKIPIEKVTVLAVGGNQDACSRGCRPFGRCCYSTVLTPRRRAIGQRRCRGSVRQGQVPADKFHADPENTCHSVA